MRIMKANLNSLAVEVQVEAEPESLFFSSKQGPIKRAAVPNTGTIGPGRGSLAFTGKFRSCSSSLLFFSTDPPSHCCFRYSKI